MTAAGVLALVASALWAIVSGMQRAHYRDHEKWHMRWLWVLLAVASVLMGMAGLGYLEAAS